MSSATKKTRKKKVIKAEVKKDLTPQLVTRELADNIYTGLIREDHLGSQFLDSHTASYTWTTGTKYDGPFVESTIAGKGKFLWTDGSTYEGELLCGARHGEGTYVSADGATCYMGHWSQGKRDGQGRLNYCADGSSFYEGGWQAGQKHGFGKQTWPSGNSYQGQWLLGKMSGQGAMIWRHGSGSEKYSGSWVDNSPHGEGTHTWMADDQTMADTTQDSWLVKPSPPPSAAAHLHGSSKSHQTHQHQPQPHQQQQLNNRYTGQWNWGKRDGKGTFYYANGAYYHGEWQDHVKQGQGRHTFDDGQVYEGLFEADKMVNYSKPETFVGALAGLEDNPNLAIILRCTDISDLQSLVLPHDKSGFALSCGVGYSDPVKILKGVYNLLLKNLGELREAYARYRGAAPLLGEDPFIMTTCQFWVLARDAGLVTPACPIARLDRAVFGGPRHHLEMAPEDKDDLRPLTPRAPSEPRVDRLDGVDHPHFSRKNSILQQDADEKLSQAGSAEEVSSLASSLPSPSNEAVAVAVATLRNGLGLGGMDIAADDQGGPGGELGPAGSGSAPGLGKRFLRSRGGENLGNIHAPARPLLFRQFLESFVRLSLVRFPSERGLEPQVQRLFKEQVMPSLQAASSPPPRPAGPIPMVQTNAADAWKRPPPSPVFALFMQPMIQEVVREVEPLVWQLFTGLCGDELVDQCVPGGGITVGQGGIGANPCNAAPTTPAASEPLNLSGCSAVRSSNWGAPIRSLHVKARLDTTLRIKDVLRAFDCIGILSTKPPTTSVPLAEALASEQKASTVGDVISSFLGPFGLGAVPEESVAEDGDQSEDEDGSGGSAGPEDDLDALQQEKNKPPAKPLPGLGKLNFMPQGSILGGPDRDSKKKKLQQEKERIQKAKGGSKEEVAVALPPVKTLAEELASIDLTVSALDVMRILAQVLTPASLETLHWKLEANAAGLAGASEKEDPRSPRSQEQKPAVDERITVLEFMETEVVFAEFLRLLFLVADLTTRRDVKFARALSIGQRIEGFLKHVVLAHLQSGSRYVPVEAPLPPPPKLGKHYNKGVAAVVPPADPADPADPAPAPAADPAPAGDGAAGATQVEPKAPPPPPPAPPAPPELQLWRGFDHPLDNPGGGSNVKLPRRWPAGYEQEVMAWE